MKQLVKTMVMIVTAGFLLVVVRTYFYSVSTVTAGVGHTLRPGDRVLVSKVGNHFFHRGDLMVFHPAVIPTATAVAVKPHPLLQSVAVDSSVMMIGQVVAVPGDTIRMRQGRYVIPLRCCERCGCPDCRLYLVTTGKEQQLVHLHQAVGPARRIFHLPW